MNPIILITSCIHHLRKNDDCRNTWLAQWGGKIAYKFVLGRDAVQKYDDEIVLPVDDTYYGLPEKIRESHCWALKQGYDYILKVDADMWLHVPRLLASGYEKYPYSGNFHWGGFALGGSYWLNAEASGVLSRSGLPRYGTDGGDDVWVGKVMAENYIKGHHDPRYVVGKITEDFISYHTTGNLSMAEVHSQCA